MTRIVPWMAWMIVAAAGLALPEPGGDTIAERRRRVQQLPEVERAELASHFHEFSAMPREQQQSLHRLHEQIEGDADRAHLLAVMERYCRWHQSLPPFRKAELLGLPTDERVKRIKGILGDQAKWEASRPSPQDALALARWFDTYFTRHEPEIVKLVPEWFRHRLDGANAVMRKRMLVGGHAADLGRLPQPDATELGRLRQSLSTEARARLQAVPADEQWQTILGWIRQSAVRQALAGGKGGLRLTDEQELSRFFEEGLNEEQRDRVLGMPAETMRYELLRLYLGQRGGKGPESADRHGERGPGKRPGLDGFPPRRKPPSDRGPNAPPGMKRPRGEDDVRKARETEKDE